MEMAEKICILIFFGFLFPVSSESNTLQEYSETKLYSQYSGRKDYFGYSVAVFNDWIVTGAYSSSKFQLDSGAAFSFQKNFSVQANGTVWVERSPLSPPDLTPHDYFGGSIALWETTAVVGAYLDENIGAKSGFAYIFVFSNGVWKEEQKLTSQGGALAADYFGQCVDIFENSIIVGAYRQQFRGYYRGAAYIFTKQSDLWTLSATLRPNDLTENRNNMMFGYCVQIMNTTAVVGAYGDNFQGANTGAVYVFHFKYFDQTYSTGEWIQTHKLIPRDARQQSNFGIAIDLSREYVQNNRGYFLSIVVGANLGRGNNAGTGCAYLFRSKVTTPVSASTQWTQQSKLYAPDGNGEELFGTSVAIDGPLIAIGAPDDSSRGTDSGSVYVFRRSATAISSSSSSSSTVSHQVKWSFLRKIVGNDTQPYDNFGSSLSIYEDTIAIGSVHTDGRVSSTGAVYVIIEGEKAPMTIKKNTLLETEKDQFVFILTLFPVLLVLLPVCVMSSVVYFNNKYSSFASAMSRGIKRSDVALQEYASLHGSSSHHNTKSDLMGRAFELGVRFSSSISSFLIFFIFILSVADGSAAELCRMGRSLSS
jgi:hypothetical protein